MAKSMNKRGAMEMTMGTVVTIVLLVAVLVVVLFFINQIRTTGSKAISGIDSAIQNQISKAFADDDSKKIVVVPPERQITIKKGEASLGFGFSIRNLEPTTGIFSYEIKAEETSCEQLSLSQADALITLGKRRGSITVPAGDIMDDPVFVRFGIPETAPPCEARYSINVRRGGEAYGSSVDVDLKIESK